MIPDREVGDVPIGVWLDLGVEKIKVKFFPRAGVKMKCAQFECVISTEWLSVSEGLAVYNHVDCISGVIDQSRIIGYLCDYLKRRGIPFSKDRDF